MTEQFESEEDLREREATRDDGGDVPETPEGDEHGRDADPVTRPGPAPDERTTGERPSPG